jgi:hypothetical protein
MGRGVNVIWPDDEHDQIRNAVFKIEVAGDPNTSRLTNQQ